MQNILFFLLCALLTGCHAGTSRPELPEMVEYSGPNASSLMTFNRIDRSDQTGPPGIDHGGGI